MTKNIGVNTFGLKFALHEDFDGTLNRLKNGKISSIEPCIIFNGETEKTAGSYSLDIPVDVLKRMDGGIWSEAVAEVRCAKVRAEGFEIISVHVMTPGITPKIIGDLVPKLLEFGKLNGVQYYVLSLMVGPEKMKEFIPAMRDASEKLTNAGITLCYHNHEMECYDQKGDTALDLLMRECPQLMLELDVGWAKFAGRNPVTFMCQYAERLKLVHLKDIRSDACQENRESCFTIVGEGSIPLREILNEAKRMRIAENAVIIDQDASVGDIVSDIVTGVKYVSAYI